MNKKVTLIAGMVFLALFLVACGGGETTTETVTVEVTRIVEVEVPAEGGGDAEAVEFAGGDETLAQVQGRGVLNCGGNQSVPGFGYLDPDSGAFSGFDIDFCKAIAAAVLGDSEAIEVTPTTGQSRFPTLQSGEVDVLIRNTTHTLTRDVSLGFDFVPITFYDGQGMMVRADSGITTLEELDGATICVQSGTTTELNLATVFDSRGINYEATVFPDAPTTLEAYDQGSCDGFTTDKSGLVANQVLLSEPEAHVILEETMSREPLGPLTRHGDNNWNDIVNWTVLCTINAEFLGVTQGNVDSMLGGDDPDIARLLGEEGDLGAQLGLSADFCYQIISQVGNYEDIYNANLGPDTPFDLARGLNALYTDGGILYPVPFK